MISAVCIFSLVSIMVKRVLRHVAHWDMVEFLHWGSGSNKTTVHTTDGPNGDDNIISVDYLENSTTPTAMI